MKQRDWRGLRLCGKCIYDFRNSVCYPTESHKKTLGEPNVGILYGREEQFRVVFSQTESIPYKFGKNEIIFNNLGF